MGKGEKFRDCSPWRGKLQNPSRIHRKHPPLHRAFTVALVRHPPLREPLTIAGHHRPCTSSQPYKTMLAGGTTGIEVALQNNDKQLMRL
jgi:hypothetical protein